MGQYVLPPVNTMRTYLRLRSTRIYCAVLLVFVNVLFVFFCLFYLLLLQSFVCYSRDFAPTYIAWNIIRRWTLLVFEPACSWPDTLFTVDEAKKKKAQHISDKFLFEYIIKIDGVGCTLTQSMRRVFVVWWFVCCWHLRGLGHRWCLVGSARSRC